MRFKASEKNEMTKVSLKNYGNTNATNKRRMA